MYAHVLKSLNKLHRQNCSTFTCVTLTSAPRFIPVSAPLAPQFISPTLPPTDTITENNLDHLRNMDTDLFNYNQDGSDAEMNSYSQEDMEVDNMVDFPSSDSPELRFEYRCAQTTLPSKTLRTVCTV